MVWGSEASKGVKQLNISNVRIPIDQISHFSFEFFLPKTSGAINSGVPGDPKLNFYPFFLPSGILTANPKSATFIFSKLFV